MVCQVLGLDNDKEVNEAISGFLFFLSPLIGSLVIKFRYAQFIVENIHLQLKKFTTLKYFRYQSYMVLMI